MAAPEPDSHNLSEQQKLALESYTAVTGQNIQEAIPLLRRSQWSVEIAISKFFDGEFPDPISEITTAQDFSLPRSTRQMNVQQGLLNGNKKSLSHEKQPDQAPRIVPQPETDMIRQPPYMLAILFTPFNLLCRLVSSSCNIFYYIFSFSNLRSQNFMSQRQSLGRRPLKPRDCAARLKREFEEEYGSNSLPFFEGGYAQALDLAKSHFKFLVILLISPEHDDTTNFVKETLLDPLVQEFLQKSENNIILWAGDVRDSEAYQVSSAVKCSKFPFTAVVAHTPNISSTSMSVILSISGTIDTAKYLSKLRVAIMKHEEQLSIARTNRSAQDLERNLRQQQDSAYERSLALDRERARLKKEADAAAAEAKRIEMNRQATAALYAEKKLQWRKWRSNSIKPEPGPDDKDIVKVALKMPENLGAGRVIRKFRANDGIEELYAFVECFELLQSDNHLTASKPMDYDHEYQFLLVQSLPRVVFHVNQGDTIGEKIGKNGNLIVELIVPEDQESKET
ncbi:UBX domain-containing protein 10 [Erysiphe necator]|nr:UBX domain-containing protein 10 [Erysiphe necator]